MMYDSIFARSFNKHEQRRLKYGAFVSCFLLFLSLCTVFKPYLGPIQDLNLRLSMGERVKMRMVSDTPSSPKMEKVEDIVANIIVNDTRNSPQVEEVEKAIEPNKSLVIDTSSSSPVNEDKDIIIKVPVNDTSIFQQIAEGSEVEEDTSTKILVNDTSSSHIHTVSVTKKEEPELVCTSEARTDFCESRGDIRVQGSSSTVYVVSPETSTSSKIIKPYARKDDTFALSMVREWSVKPLEGSSSKQVLECSQNHTVPAILFSTGGYAGNHFHEFTDILIPLFLTSRKFNGEVQFLVTNYRAWWLSKYQVPLKKLSNYEFIDIDKDDQVHCFPSVTVGLKRYEKELRFDPLKYSYSMKDYRDFLRSSYSLKRDKAIRLSRDGENRKPRLMIITRKKTRSFTNPDDIVNMAKRLGFEVITMEGGGNLSRFAEIVNSCDVLMGVHGAGLTNIVFLPENAVFIQIVPYGGLDWLAKQDFGLPSEEMNLKYLLYNIKVEESTLIQQYPPDHAVLKDPSSIQGWDSVKSVYLEKQNVKLDVDRFRPTLQKALELLHQ